MWREIVFSSPGMKVKRIYLRKKSTEYEDLLWEELRNNKLGFKFKRQFSVGPYILDFYCPKKKLAIELDGEGHAARNQKKYDDYRSKYLEDLGIKVIRFWNGDLIGKMDEVLAKIHDIISL